MVRCQAAEAARFCEWRDNKCIERQDVKEKDDEWKEEEEDGDDKRKNEENWMDGCYSRFGEDEVQCKTAAESCQWLKSKCVEKHGNRDNLGRDRDGEKREGRDRRKPFAGRGKMDKKKNWPFGLRDKKKILIGLAAVGAFVGLCCCLCCFAVLVSRRRGSKVGSNEQAPTTTAAVEQNPEPLQVIGTPTSEQAPTTTTDGKLNSEPMPVAGIPTSEQALTTTAAVKQNPEPLQVTGVPISTA